MQSETITLNKGKNTIEIDATTFASGEYFIAFRDKAKKISYENKFLKL